MSGGSVSQYSVQHKGQKLYRWS